MHQEVTPNNKKYSEGCKAIGDTAFNTTKGDQTERKQIT